LLSTFAGLAALIAAPLWGRFSDSASKPRRLLQFELLASAVLMLILSQQVSFGWIAVIVVLDAFLNAGSSPSSDQPKRSLRQSIRMVLSDPRLRRLALALGIFLSMMYGLRLFESLYLKQLGAGEAVVGLMSTIGATIELPGMLWADRLVKRYGAVRLLRCSFVLEVVRLTGVLLVPSAPTLVLMRVVGGISFSWYVVAVFSFISEAAPDRQVTTTLALFNVTLASFIRMIAAPSSGFIFDLVGGYWLYALGAIGSLVAWLILKTMKPTSEA
jgi:PPP family 3-phenylpropionic acid transporter